MTFSEAMDTGRDSTGGFVVDGGMTYELDGLTGEWSEGGTVFTFFVTESGSLDTSATPVLEYINPDDPTGLQDEHDNIPC